MSILALFYRKHFYSLREYRTQVKYLYEDIHIGFVCEWHKRVVVPFVRWRNPVPKSEFDPSLNMDVLAMSRMSDKQLDRYLKDLAWRRHLAHERELK